MKSVKFTLIFFACSMLSSCIYAQAIHLTGRIVDDNFTPVSGAFVSLKGTGYSTQTGADGRFVLMTDVPVIYHAETGKPEQHPFIRNGALMFSVKHETQPVAIRVCSLNGRTIMPCLRATLSAGSYRFVPPSTISTVCRQCIVVLDLDGSRTVHSLLTLRTQRGGLVRISDAIETQTKSGLAKSSGAKTTTDTLVISKALFATTRKALQSFSTDLGDIVIQKIVTDTAAFASLTADSLYHLAYVQYSANAYDSSIVLFTAYLTLHPEGAGASDAGYYLARSLFEQGQRTESHKAFLTFLHNYPTSGKVDWATNYVGRTYLDAGVFDSARVWFTKVLTAYPDSASADNAQFYIGQSYYIQNDYSSAVSAFTALISSYPNGTFLADAHYYLGRCRMHLGDYIASLAEFDTVLAAYPTSSRCADAELGIGDCYMQMAATDSTTYDSAIVAYGKVVGTYPNSSAITGAIEGTGESYYYLGDYTSARTWLTQIGTGYPLSIYVPASYYWLGRCDMQESKYDSSLVWFSKLTQDYPSASKATSAYYQIGKCYYYKQDYPPALGAFTTYRTRSPGRSFGDNSYYFTVRIYALQGNCPKAKSELANMESLYPSSTVLASTQTYIAVHCP